MSKSNMSFREHQWLPTLNEADYLDKVYQKHYMSYRKIEHCYVKGCRNFGQPYRNLAQHLRSQHNLEKSDYNRMFPVVNVTYNTPNQAPDLSILMPGEKVYYEKPDIGEFSDLPVWFIRTWLKDGSFSNTIISDEYPEYRIYHFECDPRGIFKGNNENLVYHEGYLSLNLRQQFGIQKMIHSWEEEYYFLRSITSPGFSLSMFHRRIYEFECLFCETNHQA